MRTGVKGFVFARVGVVKGCWGCCTCWFGLGKVAVVFDVVLESAVGLGRRWEGDMVVG